MMPIPTPLQIFVVESEAFTIAIPKFVALYVNWYLFLFDVYFQKTFQWERVRKTLE